MAQNYYAEINLHIVWHTKSSSPLLTPRVEPFVHRYLKQKLVNLPGEFVHEINGTENHVHVVVSIAPTILVSDMIGKLKGASSHEANRQFGNLGKVLEWQAGYGVVTFGTRHLPWIIEYVRNQKEHHAKGTIHDRFERIEPLDDGSAAKAATARRPVNGPPD